MNWGKFYQERLDYYQNKVFDAAMMESLRKLRVQRSKSLRKQLKRAKTKFRRERLRQLIKEDYANELAIKLREQ